MGGVFSSNNQSEDEKSNQRGDGKETDSREANEYSTPPPERSRDKKEAGSSKTPSRVLKAPTTEEYKKAFPTLFEAAGVLTKTQLKQKANKTALQRMPGSNKQDYIRAFLETCAKRDEKSPAPMSKLKQLLTSEAKSRLDEQPDKVAEEWANLLFYYSDDPETDFEIDPVSCNLLLESTEGLTIKQMKPKVAQMDLDGPKSSTTKPVLRLGLIKTAARIAADKLLEKEDKGVVDMKLRFGDMKELRDRLLKAGNDNLDKLMANKETAVRLRIQWMRAVRYYYNRINTTTKTVKNLKNEMDDAKKEKKK